MSRNRASRRNNTRERLINHAMRLIWLNGYTEVSISTIAKSAKALKGSVYHFFPSKLDLLIACMDHMNELHVAKLKQIRTHSDSPQNILINYLDWLCIAQKRAKQRYGHTPGFFYMALGGAITEQDEKLAAELKASHESLLTYFQSLFKEMVENGNITGDAEALGNTVMYMATGAVAVARVTNDTKVLDDMMLGIKKLLKEHSISPQPLSNVVGK